MSANKHGLGIMIKVIPKDVGIFGFMAALKDTTGRCSNAESVPNEHHREPKQQGRTNLTGVFKDYSSIPHLMQQRVRFPDF